MLRNGPPDGRHIMQVTLAHVGHMGSMIPEAHAKLVIDGPAVSLMGCCIRGGQGFAPNKGIVGHQGHEA